MIAMLRGLVSIHPRRTPGERSFEKDPLDITWFRSTSLNIKEIRLTYSNGKHFIVSPASQQNLYWISTTLYINFQSVFANQNT